MEGSPFRHWRPQASGQAALVAIARWETQYAPEWLAYHRSIGFGHVFLTCNDDDPTALWEAVLPFTMGSGPFVTFTHFPWRGQRFHMLMQGLRRAQRHYPWLMILDLDEFLHLPRHHDVEQFLDEAAGDWDAVHFNRIGFGNSGYTERPPGGVLRTYVRRQPDLTASTRVLVRSSRLRLEPAPDPSPVWTDPAPLLLPDARHVDVLGRMMREPPRGKIDPESAVRMREAGLIHHYQFKSEQDFLLRCARGMEGAFAGQALWRELHQKGQHRAVLAELNAVEDRSLAQFWTARLTAGAARATTLQAPARPNLALNKDARQSSISDWSSSPDPAKDAAGLVSGRITGSYQCHTRHEEHPWWSVDLGADAQVGEIRVFNRCDSQELAQRARAYEMAASRDGRVWLTLRRQEDGPAFGGADGNPLVVQLPSPVPARFIRVTLLSTTNLHLDQVEVYGRMA